jgi:hypothetical protein
VKNLSPTMRSRGRQSVLTNSRQSRGASLAAQPAQIIGRQFTLAQRERVGVRENRSIKNVTPLTKAVNNSQVAHRIQKLLIPRLRPGVGRQAERDTAFDTHLASVPGNNIQGDFPGQLRAQNSFRRE